MGIGNFFKRVFGTETKRPWADQSDDGLLRLWRAQRSLGQISVDAIRDEIARRGVYPTFLDAPDPYIPRLPGVDALYQGETLTRWLRRFDPTAREEEPVQFLQDGLVVSGGGDRKVAVLLPTQSPSQPSPEVTDVVLVGDRDRFPDDATLASRFPNRALVVHGGSPDGGHRLGTAVVRVFARQDDGPAGSEPFAVVDDQDEELRYMVGTSVPFEALLAPLDEDDEIVVPAFVVGGLGVNAVAAEEGDATVPAPEPRSGRGLTAAQAAASLAGRLRQNEGSFGSAIQRAQIDRVVVLPGATLVDVSLSLALARELGIPAGALGGVGPATLDEGSTEASLARVLVLLGAESPDATDLLARLAATEAFPESFRSLIRGLAHEVAGRVDAARAEYEEAAESDPRADAQLLALDANSGRTDVGLRRIPVVSDEPDFIQEINRSLTEWRFGRAEPARSILIECDASAISLLGRAIEDTVTMGRPGSPVIPMVSPLLLEAGQTDLARAYLVAGDRVTGERLLRRALHLEPGNAAAAALLATHLLRTGQPAEALSTIDAVLRRYSHSSDFLALRVDTLQALGRKQEALSVLDGLVDEAASRLEARLARIVLLIQLGDRDRARADAQLLPGDGGDSTLVSAVLSRLDAS